MAVDLMSLNWAYVAHVTHVQAPGGGGPLVPSVLPDVLLSTHSGT